jgi:hypothetical protein
MKKIITAALILAFTLPAFARGGSHGGYHSHGGYGTGAKSERTHVGGYTKRNGKHVAGYNRSTADHTKNNNWSTRGNANPETGKRGTKAGD